MPTLIIKFKLKQCLYCILGKYCYLRTIKVCSWHIDLKKQWFKDLLQCFFLTLQLLWNFSVLFLYSHFLTACVLLTTKLQTIQRLELLTALLCFIMLLVHFVSACMVSAFSFRCTVCWGWEYGYDDVVSIKFLEPYIKLWIEDYLNSHRLSTPLKQKSNKSRATKHLVKSMAAD